MSTQLPIFTVVRVEDGEVTPFVEVYVTEAQALQAIENDAYERFLGTVDPNSEHPPRFDGISWNGDHTVGTSEGEFDTVYHLTRTTVK